VIDDLLAGEDDLLCRKRCFAHNTEIAPDVSVAFTIGALNVENGQVGMKGANREKLITGKWTRDGLEL